MNRGFMHETLSHISNLTLQMRSQIAHKLTSPPQKHRVEDTYYLSISIGLHTCRQEGKKKMKWCRRKSCDPGEMPPRQDRFERRQAAVIGLGAFSGYHLRPQLKHTY